MRKTKHRGSPWFRDAFASAAEGARQTAPLIGLATLLLGGWLILRMNSIGTMGMENSDIFVLVFDAKPQIPRNPYTIFAEYLAHSLEERLGARVKRATTQGSLDSLLQLDDFAERNRKAAEHDQPQRSTALALAQADVVYHYVEGGHPQFLRTRPESHVRSLIRVFSERLEFTRREPLLRDRPDSVAESEAEILHAPRVCGGEAGSGTRVTVLNVQRVLQASWRSIRACADDGLERDAVNARAVGFNRHDERARETLLGLSAGAVRVLQNSVKKGIYTPEVLNASRGTHTIAWDALLVGDRDLDGEAVDAVLASVKRLDDACRDSRLAAADGDMSALLEQTDYCDVVQIRRASREAQLALPIALHPRLMLDALDWLSAFVVRVTDPIILKVILLLLLGAGVLVSAIPGVGTLVRVDAHANWPQKLTAFILGTRVQWVLMLLVAMAFHLLIGVLVWLSELHAHALASDVDFVSGGLGRAVKWMWYFVILGSSNIELKSNLALLWVGLLKAGWAVASGALVIALARTALRGWSIFNMRKHVLVIGFNDRGGAVAAELKRAGVRAELLAGREIAPDLCADFTGIQRYRSTAACASAGADASELKDLQGMVAAAIDQGCVGIVVLSDLEQAEQEGQGDADSWTARQVIAIKHALKPLDDSNKKRKKTQSPIRVAVEIEHEANMEVVRALGADEVVCVRRFGTELLAQAVSKPGLCGVFADLLKTERGTHEIYFHALSTNQIATYRTFGGAARMLADRGANVIPIGIHRLDDEKTGRRTPMIGPTGDRARLKKDDELIVVSQLDDRASDRRGMR